MTTKLLAKAERQSKDEKLRRYPRVSRNAGKLDGSGESAAEDGRGRQDVGLGVVLDLIEQTVTRSELRHAVEAIDELAPAGDSELDGQRLTELAGKLSTVRPFLPGLMTKVRFGATPDGGPVLAAMRTLAQLLTVRTSGKLPAHLLTCSAPVRSTTTWSRARGSAWCMPLVGSRRRWTKRRTRCVCSSSSIAISSTAASSRWTRSGGAIRARICSTVRRGNRRAVRV